MRYERWLLPDGIEELLPDEAEALERLRRRLLDLHMGWGYRLVAPPIVEYLESLLTGTGSDLELETFKFVDPCSGRLMGIRADITPQVARIDAHRLGCDAPTRLCYIGSVLRTRAQGAAGSRSPLQIGAELFGHAGVESDLEILRLMVATLAAAGVDALHLDLGHVGIYRALAARAGLDGERERELFAALQRKAIPEIGELLRGSGADRSSTEALTALAGLCGGDEVLDEARARLAPLGGAVANALAELERMSAALRAALPRLPIHFDLAELRGYHFHTGAVFAAFVPGLGQEIARGGRYDRVGDAFGRARPATGFSADLTALLRLHTLAGDASPRRIAAPSVADPALAERISALRAAGERVVELLPGQAGDARATGCDAELRIERGGWVVAPLID